MTYKAFILFIMNGRDCNWGEEEAEVFKGHKILPCKDLCCDCVVPVYEFSFFYTVFSSVKRFFHRKYGVLCIRFKERDKEAGVKHRKLKKKQHITYYILQLIPFWGGLSLFFFPSLLIFCRKAFLSNSAHTH